MGKNRTKWSLIDHSTHHHSVSQILLFLLNNNNYERNLYEFEEEWESIEWKAKKSTLMKMGTGLKREIYSKSRPILEEGSREKREKFSHCNHQKSFTVWKSSLSRLFTTSSFRFPFYPLIFPFTLFINIMITNNPSLNMCTVSSYMLKLKYQTYHSFDHSIQILSPDCP